MQDPDVLKAAIARNIRERMKTYAGLPLIKPVTDSMREECCAILDKALDDFTEDEKWGF